MRNVDLSLSRFDAAALMLMFVAVAGMLLTNDFDVWWGVLSLAGVLLAVFGEPREDTEGDDE